jgi:putative PIN family toxin of toxin-antitoxin system
MLQAVIDTSSLVSYGLTRGKVMRQVVVHWRAGTFRLLTSPATRAELAAVLRRPSIQRLAVTALDDFALGVERFSHHVPGDLVVAGACRDPKDDKFLACAVEGEAHYLVSSDKDLLTMQHFQGVAIVNPGQFLLAIELYGMDAAAIAARFDPDVLTAITETVPLTPETAARVRDALER